MSDTTNTSFIGSAPGPFQGNYATGTTAGPFNGNYATITGGSTSGNAPGTYASIGGGTTGQYSFVGGGTSSSINGGSCIITDGNPFASGSPYSNGFSYGYVASSSGTELVVDTVGDGESLGRQLSFELLQGRYPEPSQLSSAIRHDQAAYAAELDAQQLTYLCRVQPVAIAMSWAEALAPGTLLTVRPPRPSSVVTDSTPVRAFLYRVVYTAPVQGVTDHSLFTLVLARVLELPSIQQCLEREPTAACCRGAECCRNGEPAITHTITVDVDGSALSRLGRRFNEALNGARKLATVAEATAGTPVNEEHDAAFSDQTPTGIGSDYDRDAAQLRPEPRTLADPELLPSNSFYLSLFVPQENSATALAVNLPALYELVQYDPCSEHLVLTLRIPAASNPTRKALLGLGRASQTPVRLRVASLLIAGESMLKNQDFLVNSAHFSPLGTSVRGHEPEPLLLHLDLVAVDNAGE